MSAETRSTSGDSLPAGPGSGGRRPQGLGGGILLAALLLVGAVPVSGQPKADERVVFFDTAAGPAAADGRRQAPIRGWIYEPVDSVLRKAAVEAALRARFDLVVTPETRANFDRRTNLFFADNERGKRISIRLAGRSIELPPSGANGHFELELPLAGNEVRRARSPEGVLTYEAVLPEGDARRFRGRVHATDARGLGVISDIDDTVKITRVTDHRALLDNTFFQDFRPVPGMAERYAAWARRGATLHFVSSSPWQLYEPLVEFLETAGFPPSVLHLKSVRIKDETLLDLFAPGTRTKPAQIVPILERFPGRRFVLVGDSGEQDPEVYAALLHRYPERIARIYIRNVTGARPDDARFAPLFAGIPASRWALFTDPGVLMLPDAP